MGLSGVGVGLSLATAILWALSPMVMASVGRRIGSHPTNLLRLLIAGGFFVAMLLPIYLLVHGTGGMPTWTQCAWLSLSGLIGMVAGDACFYEALVLLGPRRAIKVNTLAPVVALLVGWLWQNEVVTGRVLLGAGMVIGAVTYTAFTDPAPVANGGRTEPGRMSAIGLAFGTGSAVCIALGAVLARKAYLTPGADGRPLDSIFATVVRVGVSAAAFWLVPILGGTARQTIAILADAALFQRMLIGVGFGAIGGMICYIAALRDAPAGLVSTLVSTSTLLIIPMTALRYRTPIRWDVTLAACAAVAGVGLISWK